MFTTFIVLALNQSEIGNLFELMIKFSTMYLCTNCTSRKELLIMDVGFEVYIIYDILFLAF